MSWTNNLREHFDKEVIAIDGKTVKGSEYASSSMKALQCVSAFVSTNELVLAQVMVDKKSNEIEAVPQLLDLIDCKGTITTIDALNCQKKIVEKVIEKEADYLFAVKKNHRELFQDLKTKA